MSSDPASTPPPRQAAVAATSQEGATLGELLRAAREANSLTVAHIAQATKIGKRQLEAIERDDFKSLPGGIFNRAFVRAFSREVGFDPELGVRLYEKAIGATRGRNERPPDTARRRDLALVAGGLVLALLLAVTLWYFW